MGTTCLDYLKLLLFCWVKGLKSINVSINSLQRDMSVQYLLGQFNKHQETGQSLKLHKATNVMNIQLCVGGKKIPQFQKIGAYTLVIQALSCSL